MKRQEACFDKSFKVVPEVIGRGKRPLRNPDLVDWCPSCDSRCIYSAKNRRCVTASIEGDSHVRYGQIGFEAASAMVNSENESFGPRDVVSSSESVITLVGAR